jgi:hypothetical protein
MDRILRAACVTALVIALASTGGWAQGGRGPAPKGPAMGPEPKPDAAQAGAPGGIVDRKALDILKRMSDILTNAKSVSFEARSLVPVKTPRNIWVNLYGSSKVVKKGRNMLFAETRGDFAPYDFYYDGKTITAYAPDKNLYAEKPFPGDVDGLVAEAYRTEGRSFPYADILVTEPYEVLTRGLVNAVYVGQSTIGSANIKTDHLAFSNRGVGWQIWVGADDGLPRIVSATYLDDASEPSYGIEFFNWKIDAPVDDAAFAYKNTTGAQKVEFRHPNYGARRPMPPRPEAGRDEGGAI